MTYTAMALSKIDEASFLDKADMEIIKNLATDLQDGFNKREMFRTEFLARNSVLNSVKFPTEASRYWQANREQSAMFNNLTTEAMLYQKNQAELEILECELDEIKGKDKKSNAYRKIKMIEIQQKKFMLLNIKFNGHHRVREIGMWQKIMQEQIVADPTFDRINPNNHQWDSFKQRWELEKRLGVQTNHPDLFRHAFANLKTMEIENDTKRSQIS